MKVLAAGLFLVHESLLAKQIKLPEPPSVQFGIMLGVGPWGRTVGLTRIDHRTGLSKDGSPWPSTAHTASNSSVRSLRSSWPAKPCMGAKRHDICRNLIRVWVQKYEAGDFDEDAAAADLLQQYEARIAALERLVGRQALELEFLKGAVRSAPRPKSANTSVIVGPRASVLQKDAS
jgi:transposase